MERKSFLADNYTMITRMARRVTVKRKRLLTLDPHANIQITRPRLELPSHGVEIRR
jgi:hypothetical protein